YSSPASVTATHRPWSWGTCRAASSKAGSSRGAVPCSEGTSTSTAGSRPKVVNIVPSSSSVATQSTPLTSMQGSVVGPGGFLPQRATTGGSPHAATPTDWTAVTLGSSPPTVAGQWAATRWHAGESDRSNG